MILSPNWLDLWIAKELAGYLKVHPLFDLGVQSAIAHNVLGGFWFGAALFILWMQGQKVGRSDLQLRLLTTLIGSTVAILIMLLAENLIHCPPPAHNPDLKSLFPSYIYMNTDPNSFPSQSTTLYSCVAAGIYSLHKATGWVLWVMVAVLVALPRMYMGGHYLSDIFTGFVIGMAGYAIARYFLEARLTAKIGPFLERKPRLQLLSEVIVFAWILQVAVEFKDVVWLKNILVFIVG
ncbi:MAG TPA: phosphatase PAP2 family protein [Terriglobia bacterium]|nr:phosphatase PAP2 family protein [Terriglobia bacterium]